MLRRRLLIKTAGGRVARPGGELPEEREAEGIAVSAGVLSSFGFFDAAGGWEALLLLLLLHPLLHSRGPHKQHLTSTTLGYFI